jgi:hypothetical protein
MNSATPAAGQPTTPARDWTAGRIGFDVLEKAWPVLGPFVRTACEASHGRFRPEHVAELTSAGVERGGWDCWCAIDPDNNAHALAWARIVVFPTGRRDYEIVLLGGDSWDEWNRFEGELDARARELGCSHVMAMGRAALRGKLKSWRWIANVLERCVEGDDARLRNVGADDGAGDFWRGVVSYSSE